MNCTFFENSTYHPTGMLDRDQRTINIPNLSAIRENSDEISECSCSSQQKGQHRIYCESSNSQTDNGCGLCSCSRKTFRANLYQKTNDYIFLTYVWLLAVLIALPTCIKAKPFEHYRPTTSGNLQFILTHPCGLMETGSSEMSSETFTNAELKKLLGVITQQTSNALIDAELSVKKYLDITWSTTDVQAFHNLWQHREQKWLYPEGRNLIELFHEDNTVDISATPEEKLSVYANITKLLTDTDNRFQRLIIGFEQIIMEHKDQKVRRMTDSRVVDIFSTSLINLRMVLCEVRTLINKMGLHYDIVPASVMSDEDRSDNLLDWIIFREYINQLKFLKKSLAALSYNKVYLTSNFF